MLRVNTKRDSQINGKPEDPYFNKVIKYIPTEIVAAYTVMRGFLLEGKESGNIISYGDDNLYLYCVIFFGCLLLTPLYKYFSLKSLNLPVPIYQIVISFFAFIVWVFAFGDWFEINWVYYNHKLASIVLVFFTLITPVFENIFIKNNLKLN